MTPNFLQKKNERGNAMVELALVAPILFVLALAAFDFGMYVYSFISVQNAARVAALRNSGGKESASDQTAACAMVTDQLRGLPAIPSTPGSCNSAPLVVSSSLCDGSSPCGGASGSADGQLAAVVVVSYTPPVLFGVPLSGPLTVRSASEMKLRSLE
ncbi:MAG: TadE family protein [Bryobacteraceae bacterium]